MEMVKIISLWRIYYKIGGFKKNDLADFLVEI